MKPPAAVEAVLADVDRDLVDWHVPGLSVAVVANGEPVHVGGFGVRSIEAAEPVDAETLFDHGSCGKAFTALLGAVLAAEGEFDLDVPVRNYVPELRLPDPVVAERVSVRDLLSHRSGLGRHDPAWIFNPSWSHRDVVAHLAHLPLVGDLRAQWHYSNFGYALAGIAMARATNSTWEEQLAKRVLEPCGLTRSVTSVAAALDDANHAEPYVLRDGAAVRTQWRIMPAMAPAGKMLSSADDSARWLQLQLGSQLDGGAIDFATVQSTHRLQAALPEEVAPFPALRFYGYSMGWLVGTVHGRHALAHSGGVDGFSAHTLLLPDDGIGLRIACSQHLSQYPFALALDIATALLGIADDSSWRERLKSPEPDAAASKAAASVGAKDAPPVHALSAYAGTFRDGGYGDVTVQVDGDALAVRIGEADLIASHRHLDTWDLHYEPLEVDFALTFGTDADGAVADAVLASDAMESKVRFTRLDGGE